MNKIVASLGGPVLSQARRLQRMRHSQSARSVVGQIPILRRSGMTITTRSINTSKTPYYSGTIP
jgi:hypothetical protein